MREPNAARGEQDTAEDEAMFVWCAGCQQMHPREDFAPDLTRKSGLSYYCRVYKERYDKEYYHKHKQEAKDRVKKSRANIGDQEPKPPRLELFICARPGCGKEFYAYRSTRSSKKMCCSSECAAMLQHAEAGHTTKLQAECGCGCGQIVSYYASSQKRPGAPVFVNQRHYHNWRAGRKTE